MSRKSHGYDYFMNKSIKTPKIAAHATFADPQYVNLTGREGNRFVVPSFVDIVRSEAIAAYSRRVPILMGYRIGATTL